jgi:acetate kinase
VRILIANVGSTSFKYKLYVDRVAVAHGRLERIGDKVSPQVYCVGDETEERSVSLPDYATAVRSALDSLTKTVLGSIDELDAVGFKTVHLRGEAGTLELTADVLERMADYNDLAPAHNPPYIEAIRIFREIEPALKLIGLFESAYHTTIPDYAYMYGVPYSWYEKYGVRKYGFHGASHRYVSERIPELIGRASAGLRIVSCHLGGSSSLCAIKDGKSRDTTMGFSPQDGVINATRNGSIDPFIIPHVMDREGLSTDQIRKILNSQSGLLGLSGVSGDMRDLQEAAENGNDRARLAIEAYGYSVRREIGAMATAIGGMDVLAFAGGIGERSPAVRSLICGELEHLGVFLDENRNAGGHLEREISSDESTTRAYIVATDEEAIVERAVAEYLETSP